MAWLLRKNLALGAEYRFKPNHLQALGAAAGLGAALREDDWKDLFVAWAPSKNLSLTLACDLAIAWTLLHGEARAAFREALPLDDGTWARGRGWTIWKALIVAAGLPGSSEEEQTKSRAIIADLVGEHV